MTKKLCVKINQSLLELTVGDITREKVDAIVNAANSSLLGGGGVDGAIHRAAGPGLLAETRKLGGCQTGDAKISRGYHLPAHYVIHAVGPMYRRGDESMPRLLASAYRRSLEVAAEHQLESIAFSAISTGGYGYPFAEAAPVALGTIVDYLLAHTQIKLVRLVLYNERTFESFAEALQQLAQTNSAISYIDNE